ncbi:hypothetical protein F4813DRAFT_360956 [Daldinia decipiens]|uniref:uncharacterized protein n=1 Tax=Daldinia decipiens TaxID=326647 RepID=UPI0020C4A47A|nr:uncharacterized protein F4813DRAFT_360956 [Daldinia decipiens]KAI1657287.1 hypothetical protein F4813DRAFT_360956 [Daldinia decipiens]
MSANYVLLLLIVFIGGSYGLTDARIVRSGIIIYILDLLFSLPHMRNRVRTPLVDRGQFSSLKPYSTMFFME